MKCEDLRMPIKQIAPTPKKFPCHIGIDFWMKSHEPIPGKKSRRPSQIFYKNTDALMDIDGWVDTNYWLPLTFDLCWLKTDQKTKTGWWTGKNWEGSKLKTCESVLYWKRCMEDMSR